jgi:hypothetical protein
MSAAIISPSAVSRAHRLVQAAIAVGRLVRPAICESCGRPPRSQYRANVLHAHHDDYSKPLDVRWLCSPCHKAHHVAQRRADGTYRKPGLSPGNRRRDGTVIAASATAA